ncbi:hypothetical protein ASF78_20330 [Cellulomonas sp. Leaf334]|nr:hypothetical protein ASF78_20330 [Cellulomonas sp. Leaf334]
MARPGRSHNELVPNDDGTISIWFGDERCAGKPNVIEATEGQRFYYGIRMYRPLDADETVAYVDRLRTAPISPTG